MVEWDLELSETQTRAGRDMHADLLQSCPPKTYPRTDPAHRDKFHSQCAAEASEVRRRGER